MACGACFAVALLLFHKEFTRQGSRPQSSERGRQDPSLYSRFESLYQSAENEEKIVSDVTNEVEGLAGKSNVDIELVDCHLRLWFAASKLPVLTRSIRNFAEDDSFAVGASSLQKRRLVFLCYNRTGVTGGKLRLLSFQAKSKLPRRRDARNLLIVITRDSTSRETMSAQLSSFPNDFKEIIHADASFVTEPSTALKCIKQLFIKMSFGFRMSLQFPRGAVSMTRCLSDWASTDRKGECSPTLSKVQVLRRMTFVKEPHPHVRIYSYSDVEPCFNTTFDIELNPLDPRNSPRIPISVDNEVTAYAFDLHVSKSEFRGHVFNMTVLSIMILLGASLWLLSGASSADTLLALLCTVSSSGGCSKTLRNKVASAASMWTLGNMFFALLLIDDMTSSITVPDNSRIQELQDCAWLKAVTFRGRRYVKLNIRSWLRLIVDDPEWLSGQDPIFCDSRSELDGLRRFFDYRNLYRIKLESYGQRYTAEPPEDFVCPPGSSAAKCRGVRSFVDNSEWNDYASIVFQFDLLKYPIRERSKFLSKQSKMTIERKHGCCKDRSTWSVELRAVLHEYEPRSSDSVRISHCDLFSKFVSIGSGVALMCFALELLIWSASRVRSKMRVGIEKTPLP